MHRIGAMPRGAFLLWFTREGSCWWNPSSLPVITFTAGFLQIFLHFIGHRVLFLMVVQCHMESVRRLVFTFTLLHYRKHCSQKTQLFAKMPHSFFSVGGKSCSQLFLQLRILQSYTQFMLTWKFSSDLQAWWNYRFFDIFFFFPPNG